MEYRQLGWSGLRISRLVLGCGNFGGIGSAPAFFGMGENEAQAFELMDRAADAGITVFDTADAYGGGRSESFIGRWLHARGPRMRDRILVSSKVFNATGPGPNDRGLSRTHVLSSVDESLRRLRTDRLDLYLIHEPDPETPIEETLDALHDLVRAGKVLYVGASNVDARQVSRAAAVSEARRLVRFGWVQNSYSLLDRGAERELLPLCEAAGLGFTAFSPLAGGWLTGKYRRGTSYPDGSRMTLRPEPYRHLERGAIFDAIDRLDQLARARGISMSALALAWALAHPRMDAVIVGPRRPAHLDDALRALEIRLSESEREEIGRMFPLG
jgi:aryl-alcohol dehydrogenase-like predicted oxidoreductase